MITCKYLVIGGGFFGSYLGCLLKQENKSGSVVIVEREKELLKRASYNNQARIHNGYHYPRSFLTAFSSHKNFDAFVEEFKECVVSDFDKYYAIGSLQSKVRANQFKTFCQRIGAPIDVASGNIKALVNPNLIEEVFKVKEYAFNADILRRLMLKKLKNKKIKLFLRHEAIKVSEKKMRDNKKVLQTEMLNLKSNKKFVIESEYVFVCAYSNINTILQRSHLKKIELKHEMTEMPLIEVPSEMKGKSITVLCGPFFSIMPFPAKGVYSIHHVRYTPHYYWHDDKMNIDNQQHYDSAKESIPTNFNKIIKDVSRYIPCMAKAKHVGSIFEIKTILPRNEIDDGRPILFKKNVGNIQNLICVMGGKLDNIYDLKDKLRCLT